MRKLYLFLPILVLCYQCSKEQAGVQSEDLTGLPIYTGEALRNIFYPLGGIGTGNILMGGRGNILEFEIFNRAQKDELPPYMTFFSLWYSEEGSAPGAMVLERKFFDDFDNGFGQPRQQLSGLPRFNEVRWSGAPPLVGLDFEDQRVPLDIHLDCYNPLIPIDVAASSQPVGEFSWIISNPGAEPVDFSLALNISNPLKNLDYREKTPKHTTRNSLYSEGHLKGVFFENLIDPDHADFGTMVVATDHANEIVHTGLSSERWWDDAHILWGDFTDNGQITEQHTQFIHDGRREVVSTVLVQGHLEAGEIDTVRYYITWHVPNRVLEFSQAFGAEEIKGSQTLNYYAINSGDAREVIEKYMEGRRESRQKSLTFFDHLAHSTLPSSVLDAAASNLTILKSNLISRVENGDVHAYEGMGSNFGCCPGNCTHVWNYAQTMSSLFPSLERNVRETAFLTQTFESGYQCFRTTFPIGEHHFQNIAADGQMGNIMRVYRDWKFSGDSTWLARLWPSVRRSMEYAWYGSTGASLENHWTSSTTPWDPDMTGILSGKQHNTYDIDFYGPNMLTGGLYLGALKACFEMGDYLGDLNSDLYMKVYESGKRAYDSLLWNGSWYVQHVEKGHDKYQYGNGCLSDQLLGQYLSFNSGLGFILDPEKVRICLRSIYENNFIPDLSDFHNVQRVYALNDEGGLVLCSWPDGDREKIPFPYADEVWTGVEYQVAASLIRSGLVAEGLEIVKAVRNRYAGYNRNPYAEIESGFYYARALASWAVLEALSGFEYDGTSHTLAFNPAVNRENFSTFWSCGSGWGAFRQSAKEITLSLDSGELMLESLSIGTGEGVVPEALLLNGKEHAYKWERKNGSLVLGVAIHMTANDKINISLK